MYRRPARACLSECLDDDCYGMPSDLVSLCIGLVWAVIVDDALLQMRLGRPIGSFVLFEITMVLVSCRSNLLLPNAGSEYWSHFFIH